MAEEAAVGVRDARVPRCCKATEATEEDTPAGGEVVVGDGDRLADAAEFVDEGAGHSAEAACGLDDKREHLGLED